MRGTTALVYLPLHISLYTGTVHVLSSVAGVHPTSLESLQSCSQRSVHCKIEAKNVTYEGEREGDQRFVDADV